MKLWLLNNSTYSKGGWFTESVLWIGIVLKPIRIQLSTLMPIHIRIWILPQVLNKFFNFSYSSTGTRLHYTIILIGVKCVPIFNILKSVLNFFDKKANWALHLYEMERYGYGLDRQVLDADPNPKKDADPIRSATLWYKKTS